MIEEYTYPGSTSLDRMFDDMARLLNSAWGSPWRAAATFPASELWTSAADDEAALTMEVPGCRPDDLELSVTGSSLSIKGHREIAPPERDAIWLMRERTDARWNQTINLPFAVEPGQERAECRDGILTVRFKRSDADRPRRIPLAAR